MKKYVHFRGKKIVYSEYGTGYPVFLLHGYLETSEIWEDLANRLSGSFRVISVDLPGHGGSDIYNEIHTMEFMASVLDGMMNTLGISKAFVAGHSLGGYVTLAFAENYPSRLDGYCLFHSHPFADTFETRSKREREIKIVMSGKKFLIYPDNIRNMFAGRNLPAMNDAFERSKRIASGISGEGIISVLKGMMARPSRLETMESGKLPCLWILGALDNYIQADTMKNRVKLPSNAELCVLEGSGHLGFIEEPEKSADILSAFVRKTAK
ncbi:MAG: alpha/beta hydrolase [Bacteroidales bacterium]